MQVIFLDADVFLADPRVDRAFSCPTQLCGVRDSNPAPVRLPASAAQPPTHIDAHASRLAGHDRRDG